MASIFARRALLSARTFSTTARRLAQPDPVLKNEGKRDPEIMILGGVMVLALGGAGLYLGRTPTTANSESTVGVAESGMPWEAGGPDGKYRYHPGGKESAQPKEAPSAVNVVVIPNVNLPKELHDRYNKWGKDGY